MTGECFGCKTGFPAQVCFYKDPIVGRKYTYLCKECRENDTRYQKCQNAHTYIIEHGKVQTKTQQNKETQRERWQRNRQRNK